VIRQGQACRRGDGTFAERPGGTLALRLCSSTCPDTHDPGFADPIVSALQRANQTGRIARSESPVEAAGVSPHGFISGPTCHRERRPTGNGKAPTVVTDSPPQSVFNNKAATTTTTKRCQRPTTTSSSGLLYSRRLGRVEIRHLHRSPFLISVLVLT
jgi:hypothetical protein